MTAKNKHWYWTKYKQLNRDYLNVGLNLMAIMKIQTHTGQLNYLQFLLVFFSKMKIFSGFGKQQRTGWLGIFTLQRADPTAPLHMKIGGACIPRNC